MRLVGALEAPTGECNGGSMTDAGSVTSDETRNEIESEMKTNAWTWSDDYSKLFWEIATDVGIWVNSMSEISVKISSSDGNGL